MATQVEVLDILSLDSFLDEKPSTVYTRMYDVGREDISMLEVFWLRMITLILVAMHGSPYLCANASKT